MTDATLSARQLAPAFLTQSDMVIFILSIDPETRDKLTRKSYSCLLADGTFSLL